MANTKKEPTELSELEVDEVSLVNKGANGRRFIILKSGNAPLGGFMEESQIADILKADLGTEDATREAILKTAPELSTDATDAMVGIVKLATSYSEELPSTIFDTLAEVSGFEKASAKKAFPPKKPEEGTPEEEAEETEEEEAEEEGEAPQKKTKKGSKKMEKSDESDPIKKALEKITKEEDIDALPEDIQGPVRYLFKSNIELADKIEKMEDERLTKEYIAKAAEFTHLPKVDSFATILKSMSQKLEPEEYAAVEGIMKAADSALKESNLFAEVGSTVAIEGSPEGKLTALAKERVAKSTDGLTFEAAMAEETLAHPEIYDEMMRTRSKL